MRPARETGAARLGISLFDASLCLVNSCLTVPGRVHTVGSPNGHDVFSFSRREPTADEVDFRALRCAAAARIWK